MLEWIKEQKCTDYDLNGINKDKNPGGYQFKKQFGGKYGREVQLPGHFECYPNRLVRFAVSTGEKLKSLGSIRRGPARS